MMMSQSRRGRTAGGTTPLLFATIVVVMTVALANHTRADDDAPPTKVALGDTLAFRAVMAEAFEAEAERRDAADPAFAAHRTKWDEFFARLQVLDATFNAEADPPRLTLLLHHEAVGGPGIDPFALEDVVRRALRNRAASPDVADFAERAQMEFLVRMPGEHIAPVGLDRFARLDPASDRPSWVLLDRPRRRDRTPPEWSRNAATAAGNPRPRGLLDGEVIAVGASHGRYETPTGNWLWQRPPLFTTVEDLLTWSIVHPFLVPLLEDAGATVETVRRGSAAGDPPTGVARRMAASGKRGDTTFPPHEYAALYELEERGLLTDAEPDLNDYRRDIVARGAFVNELARRGASAPSMSSAPWEGDASSASELGGDARPRLWLSLHTDAGIRPEGLIGTLVLWRYAGDDGATRFQSIAPGAFGADAQTMPGASRMLSWRLARAMSDAIVGDLRRDYAPSWTRRAVDDRNYGEVRRPEVPGVIIELLAHQNFNDMRYALDPFFRYDLARSMVRGVGAYLYPEPGDFIMPPRPIRRWAVLPNRSTSSTHGYRDGRSGYYTSYTDYVTIWWEWDESEAGDPAWQAPTEITLEISEDGIDFRTVALPSHYIYTPEQEDARISAAIESVFGDGVGRGPNPHKPVAETPITPDPDQRVKAPATPAPDRRAEIPLKTPFGGSDHSVFAGAEDSGSLFGVRNERPPSPREIAYEAAKKAHEAAKKEGLHSLTVFLPRERDTTSEPRADLDGDGVMERVLHLRLRAWNDGGRSAPSAVLTVQLPRLLESERREARKKLWFGEQALFEIVKNAWWPPLQKSLAVTGFTRLAAPPWVDEAGRRGFVVDATESDRRRRLDPSYLGPQREFDPTAKFRTNADPGWGETQELPRPLWLARDAEIPMDDVEAALMIWRTREPDWSKLWTDLVDYPEAMPEGRIAMGAITADAFAAWGYLGIIRGWLAPTTNRSGLISHEEMFPPGTAERGVLPPEMIDEEGNVRDPNKPPKPQIHYFAGGWAGSPPPPHSTGETRERWLDYHPEWMPASSRQFLDQYAEDGVEVVIQEPEGASASE